MSVLRRLYGHVRAYRGWAVVAIISIALVSSTQLAMIALVQPLFELDQTLAILRG